MRHQAPARRDLEASRVHDGADTLGGMVGFVSLMVMGLLVAVGLATVGMARRLRRPPRRTYAWAVSKGLPGDPGELDEALAFEDVDLGERYGVEVLRGVRAWEVEGKKKDGVVVVMTPGWGESRVNGLVRLPTVARHASRIVMWDPPGLGVTPGLCGMGTGGDVRRLRAVVENEKRKAKSENQEARIVLYGWSMGAGVSVACASGWERSQREKEEVGTEPSPVTQSRDILSQGERERICGVIAESPYREAWTPAFRVMRLAGLPWRVNGPLVFAWMGLRLMGSVWWRGFDRAELARGVGCLLMVIHGTADEVCPVEDGRAIAGACEKGEVVEVMGGGHNDLWGTKFAEEVGGAVERFLMGVNEDIHHRGTEDTEKGMG